MAYLGPCTALEGRERRCLCIYNLFYEAGVQREGSGASRRGWCLGRAELNAEMRNLGFILQARGNP